jgi:hypothetical protein
MADYRFTDHARLVADLKAENGEAVAYAYATLFNGPLGQLVLSHQLALAGVGTPRDPRMSALERADHDGAARHALTLLEMAGYGRMSAAHLVAADALEGQDHDRPDRNPDADTFSGPDADADAFSGPG